MRAIWTIARRELKALFDQPAGYILLIVFTAVNAFLFFSQADLYGVASLRPMLDFLPWILLLLVPAGSMTPLAQEVRSGTLPAVRAEPSDHQDVPRAKDLGQGLCSWHPVPPSRPRSLL